jgi:hypothetical protein
MHLEHFLVGLIAGLIAMYMIVMICNSCNVNIAGLDNRPRWMMGGLRDDTGSHNAKDVFGMGFGLDQTRVGTATTDGVFAVKNGVASHNVNGVTTSEYGAHLGDPQLANFINKKKAPMRLVRQKNAVGGIVPRRNSFLDRRNKESFASKPGTTEDYLASQL